VATSLLTTVAMDEIVVCSRCGGRLSGEIPGQTCPLCAFDAGFQPGASWEADLVLPALVAGQVLFGQRYRLERELGRGGMGVVWLAWAEHLEQHVALKFLPSFFADDLVALDDLKRETRRSLELTHHHIVRIHDFHFEDDVAAISMEYVEGETLRTLQRTRAAQCFEVEEVKLWVAQLCAALGHAHDRAKIAHRDLKPGNLLINGAGELKVTDFGIAASLRQSIMRITRRPQGGTLAYMSPQQYAGELPTAADDLYALGATIYELLTSRPPFQGKDHGTLAVEITQVVPPTMTERRKQLAISDMAPIPPAWEEIVAACLQKDRAERPKTAREIAEKLSKGSSDRRSERFILAKRSIKRRLIFAACSFSAAFAVIAFRLVDLQVTSRMLQQADLRISEEAVYARRGAITDVRGEILAQTQLVHHVVADGRLIGDPAVFAELLAGPLEINSSELIKRVDFKAAGKPSPSGYIVLKRDVPDAKARQIADALRLMNVPTVSRSISFPARFLRRYSHAPLLQHVIGSYANTDRLTKGIDGIELAMEENLRGREGFRATIGDSYARIRATPSHLARPAQNGNNVRLTIDIRLQEIVETELDAAILQFRPRNATCIIMHPQTGEILAMASRPVFDPNMEARANEAGKDDDTSPMLNRAIAAAYEPGGIFGIVAATAALNEGVVDPATLIFCENGYFPRYKLRDSQEYGDLNVADVLAKNSNIGLCKLALQVGDEKLYQYVLGFGFGQKTGVALPNEHSGIVHPPKKWSQMSISRISMGHEVGVTPLQITAAMSAVANGGSFMLPQIVRDVSDDNGTIVSSYPPKIVRRVAEAKTMQAVRDALLRSVEPVAATLPAKVAGFKVAGKSATGQVMEPDGRYSRDRHRTSFIGFMPADTPVFTCLVMLEGPETEPGKDTGALVCAPIFFRIAEKAAPHL
jgi:cell division protein FtsI (penicillin-binding protein 3)